MTAPIIRFDGPYRFLRNFAFAPVRYDGETSPSVEHAYQASKTDDLSAHARIAAAATPGMARRLGRGVRLRPDFATRKLSIMRDLVRQKFRHPALRQQLLATGEARLVEGNTWGDRFWGVCSGVGENSLGRIFMMVRQELKEECVS